MEQAELKLPTVGRQVHYFPNGKDQHCEKNNAEVLPATVVQVFGSRINLAVTCMNPDAPIVLRYSVSHKDSANKDEGGNPNEAYWAWPEIK